MMAYGGVHRSEFFVLANGLPCATIGSDFPQLRLSMLGWWAFDQVWSVKQIIPD